MGCLPEIACTHLTTRTRPVSLGSGVPPGLPGTHSSIAVPETGPMKRAAIA
jgi:hypothetical protein